MASKGSLSSTKYGNRYLTFSWEIINTETDRIENNRTKISWKVIGDGSTTGYYKAGNFKFTIDGATVYSSTSRIELHYGTVVASGEYTFTHDSNGEKDFDVTIEAGIYLYEVNCTGSQNFVLDTIPRKSTLTAYNGTLGVQQVLKINRALSTFKHRLTYECGDVSGYIAGSTTTYTTDTEIPWAMPIGLAHENTRGTTVQVKLTLYTYTSGGTFVGQVTKTIQGTIPVSVAPSCSIALQDTTGLMARYGSLVQGLSNVEIAVNAQTAYSSPIALYTVEAGGAKYNTDQIELGALATAAPLIVKATVKDQRGRTGSNSRTWNVLPYGAPIISKLDVHRCNQDGTENDQGEWVKVTFSATVYPLGNQNTARYTLRYKESTAENLIDGQIWNGSYTMTDQTFIFAADSNASYDVEVEAKDNHGTSIRATSASTAFTLLNWNAKGNGMGVGKVSERENAVEFALDMYDKEDGKILGIGALINLFLPVGSMVLRYDTQNPGDLYPGTEWTQITARVLRAGSTGSIGAEGTIADGSGRTYIDVAVWRRTK